MELTYFQRAEELYRSGLSMLNDDFDGAVERIKSANSLYMLASEDDVDNFRIWLGLINTVPFVAEDEPEELTIATLTAYRDTAVQKAGDAEAINEIQNAYREACGLVSESPEEPQRHKLKVSPYVVVGGIAAVIIIAGAVIFSLPSLKSRKLPAPSLPDLLQQTPPSPTPEPQKSEPLKIEIRDPMLRRQDLDSMNPLNNSRTVPQNKNTQTNIPKSIKGTNINIRTAPNTSAKVITQLNEGNHVTLLNTQGEWSLIRLSGGEKGWVADRYLQERINSWTRHGGEAGKINGTKVNIRQSPSMKAKVLLQRNDGDLVEAVRRSNDNLWYLIYTPDGKTGWVHRDYVIRVH